MVIVLFAPGQVFEGYEIKRVLPPEGEIQRYLVLVQAAQPEGGQEAILYCRIKKKAAAAEVLAFREKWSALQALAHPHLPKVYRGDYARGPTVILSATIPVIPVAPDAFVTLVALRCSIR